MKPGWEKKTIGHLFDVQLGKMLSEKAKAGPQVPYLANFNVRWGVFDLSKLNEMNFSDKEKDKYRLQKGDLLMCEGGEIGRCAIWQGYDMEVYYQKALHRVRPKCADVSADYLYFYMQFIASQGKLTRLVGETSIAHLTREKLLGLPITLPPLPEQKAIADLLSTWDEAIEKTERLIQAKNKRFRWLLRELISEPRNTQKDAKWKKVKIGDVCKVTMGSSPSSSAYNEEKDGMPLLQGKADLKDRRSKPRIYTTEITKTCEIGDLLMSVRAPVGYISISQHQCCIGRGIAAITVRDGYSRDFIFYSLLSSEHKWIAVSQGGTFEAVSGPEVKAFALLLPSFYEQKAIAETLSSAQHEIDLLKQLADKYKTQKRGLMQKMLTGIWRVKPEIVKTFAE
jgi:type I restriction enzyme S subunit